MVKRRKTRKTRRKLQRGGNIAAFVGKALNYSDLNTWPGVTTHGGNHYLKNEFPVDLQTGNNIVSENDSFFKQNLMSGGYIYGNRRSFSSRLTKISKRKSRRSKRKYKGGAGTLPILGDIRLAGQLVQTNVANTHDILKGQEIGVSPLPWKNQFGSI
jgi:hypothetical protein